MTRTPPLRVGSTVRLGKFWGRYADPQEARVVEVIAEVVIPARVKVEPPLDGVAWWPLRELRKVRAT